MRTYVAVEVYFSPEGHIRPKAIIWHDDRRFEITRVLKERNTLDSASWELRYDVIIDGQMKLLYAEEVTKVTGRLTQRTGLRWYVER